MIRNFQYGSKESSASNTFNLSSEDNEVKFRASASEMLVLFKYIPIIFYQARLIELLSTSLCWLSFLLLREIVSISFASEIGMMTIEKLEKLVTHYLLTFDNAYGYAQRIPKHHLLVHFGAQMSRFGPLRFTSCMEYLIQQCLLECTPMFFQMSFILTGLVQFGDETEMVDIYVGSSLADVHAQLVALFDLDPNQYIIQVYESKISLITNMNSVDLLKVQNTPTSSHRSQAISDVESVSPICLIPTNLPSNHFDSSQDNLSVSCKDHLDQMSSDNENHSPQVESFNSVEPSVKCQRDSKGKRDLDNLRELPPLPLSHMLPSFPIQIKSAIVSADSSQLKEFITKLNDAFDNNQMTKGTTTQIIVESFRLRRCYLQLGQSMQQILNEMRFSQRIAFIKLEFELIAKVSLLVATQQIRKFLDNIISYEMYGQLPDDHVCTTSIKPGTI
ncbi:unnamed protein product [Rotaria sp. Silwood1]|nr:unnamed protein product [Rotaria sp. Silwood1]